MKDLVLKGFVKDFVSTTDLSTKNESDMFEAFSISVIMKKFHACESSDIDEFMTGGGIDGGIDGIAILINGRPVRTAEDLAFFSKHFRKLNFEFVFIQSKTSPEFDAGGIGTFLYGVSQFFSEKPKIRFNDEVEQLRNLKNEVYEMCISMDENPCCYAYYITTGIWNTDPEPLARIDSGKTDLLRTNLFSQVFAEPVDANKLKEIYRELKRGVSKEVKFDKTVTFPFIESVNEAYLGLLSGKEYLKLISNADESLNRNLFYDNIRDYQGNNPVNRDIATTLNGNSVSLFPLLNNGITIVARNISRTGDNFRISDFQIVNGCQTTHVFFEKRHLITDETFIPIKLVVTDDSEIITKVIKATNWQTAVMPEALESLSPFHKDIEDFYNSQQSSIPKELRVHYERRSKQYYFEQIQTSNIVSLAIQTKSFVAMFLNEPHSHPRYYGELLKAYETKLFVLDHKPAAYFISGLTFVMVHRIITKESIPKNMKKYTYHILMLLRINLMGEALPKMNSNKITSYCLEMLDKLNDEETLLQTFTNIISDINDTLKTSAGVTVDGNTPDRLKSFTESLLQNFRTKSKETVVKIPELTTGAIEKGTLRWFDDVKGYGFIDRDAGGDIFVHITALQNVSWSQRKEGTYVEYTIIEGKKGKQANNVKTLA